MRTRTAIVKPTMNYVGLVVAFVARYVPKTGVGTLIAMMLPDSMAVPILRPMFFCLSTLILGMPVGPASPAFYEIGG